MPAWQSLYCSLCPPSLLFQFHICLCERGRRRCAQICCLFAVCVCVRVWWKMGGWGCTLWCVQLCCGDDRWGLHSSAGSFQAARSMVHLITFLFPPLSLLLSPFSFPGSSHQYRAVCGGFRPAVSPHPTWPPFLLKAADGCWLLLEARTKYFWKCSLN